MKQIVGVGSLKGIVIFQKRYAEKIKKRGPNRKS